MSKKLLFLISTEYHLLLAMYYLYSNNYLFSKEHENTFLLKAGTNSKRLNKQLDFGSLPLKIHYLDFNPGFNEPISKELKEDLNNLCGQDILEFGFFQEQDFVALIIVNLLKNRSTKINLFEDGIKPYVYESLSFTPSLHIHDFRVNKYIKQNGYNVGDWFSIFKCHNYGFLKGIDSLYLTFPESFPRKHKLKLNRLDFKIDAQLLKIYQNIFNWKDELLKHRDNVIFFMDQPMGDDGSFDLNILRKLRERYPDYPIIIKNHPLTPKEKIEQYKSLDNCTIIDSKIPAELFLVTLNRSIILSVCSTSMFVDNTSCSFYYLYNIEEHNNIERLNKYTLVNPTSHVLVPKRIEEIQL
jgi:hypothetical protein